MTSMMFFLMRLLHSLFFSAGVDFTGPDPPLLTFTPGQSVGDIQCANITVIEDSIPQPERTIVVTLGNNRTVGGIERISSVRVNTSIPSLSFDIDTDINDRKLMFIFFI
jgi:hypothetical protein